MPFASTFAAFFSRGHDFLRMAGISGANIKLCGGGRGDQVTLAGAAGATVHQCLRAADDLAADGIAARIIDLYSVKPLDQATLAEAATGGRLVITEDHYSKAASTPPSSPDCCGRPRSRPVPAGYRDPVPVG